MHFFDLEHAAGWLHAYLQYVEQMLVLNCCFHRMQRTTT